MTTTPTPGDASHAEEETRYLRALGHAVDDRVTSLQRRYLANTSDGRALLAQLRHAVMKEPGADPSVWEITVGHLPGSPATSDAPTTTERAAHTALTLYATHQQSRAEGMHVPGIGLGTAVRRLGHVTDAEDAVRRRFDAAATAAVFAETVHHLRGLVTQLRGARVGLDYGRLADDLDQLQRPGGADKVRLRWARQYYRTQQHVPTSTSDSSISAEEAR